MNPISERMDAFWLSKLGVACLAELPGGAVVGNPLEKALGVLRQLKGDRERFHELIQEGFDGYFHQSVYARTVGTKSMAGPLAGLPVGKSHGAVEWWAQQSQLSKGYTRVLAGVQKEMEFISATNQFVQQTITIPAIVEALPRRLRVRVLTVQSTAITWTELLGIPIRRILTPVVDNELADLIYDALGQLTPGIGEMQDLSEQAVELMKDTGRVYTYSGTFGVRTVGRTRHTSEGGRLGTRRQPLHVVMRPEFDELISADQIRHCEVEFQAEWEGLPPKTAVVLYPVEGKIVFRRMLGRGVIDDFLANVAR
jgi:hypothetical protein